jgi:hypothetical protein
MAASLQMVNSCNSMEPLYKFAEQNLSIVGLKSTGVPVPQKLDYSLHLRGINHLQILSTN